MHFVIITIFITMQTPDMHLTHTPLSLGFILVFKSSVKHQFRTSCVGVWSWNAGSAGVDVLCSAVETWYDCPAMHNTCTTVERTL